MITYTELKAVASKDFMDKFTRMEENMAKVSRTDWSDRTAAKRAIRKECLEGLKYDNELMKKVEIYRHNKSVKNALKVLA